MSCTLGRNHEDWQIIGVTEESQLHCSGSQFGQQETPDWKKIIELHTTYNVDHSLFS